MTNTTPLPPPIALAEWADWFCRNVKDPQDFHWVHMVKEYGADWEEIDEAQEIADAAIAKAGD